MQQLLIMYATLTKKIAIHEKNQIHSWTIVWHKWNVEKKTKYILSHNIWNTNNKQENNFPRKLHIEFIVLGIIILFLMHFY